MATSMERVSPHRWAWLSPWMIMGAVLILAVILVLIAYWNFNREKEFMERALASQGRVLIHSMEASGRTGMMGMGWGKRQLQLLMEETARQPDVLYVALMDGEGRVAAHSEPASVGTILHRSLPEDGRVEHGFTRGAGRAFEVIKAYQPWQGGPHMRGRGGMMGRAGGTAPWESQGGLYLLVGLDPSPFENARRQDLQQTVFHFLVMLLAGAAGFVSLLWAQNYRAARQSFLDVQAFASTIVSQMPVGLVTTDLRGRIERMNPAAREIFRGGRRTYVTMEDLPCLLPIEMRLREKDTVIEEETFCRIRLGLAVPLLVNASVVKDASGRKTGHVYLFSDTSNIKQLEDQLRRSERLAALGRLAAGVAHEIRNPLSSIKGFAGILAGRLGGDEKGRELARVMAQEVDRINRVVSELLDFAGPTDLVRTSCSCRELIERCFRLIEHDAKHQRVKLECLVEPRDLKIHVDADRFTQALLNLCLNGLQAMEKGGVLKVRALSQGDRMILRVSDTGVGIGPEDLPHVFDPYFTTKPRGVGLGLANVHKIVQAHGGEIEVQSVMGEGSVFTVRLPGTVAGREGGLEGEAGESEAGT